MGEPKLYVDDSFLHIFDELLSLNNPSFCNINLFSIKIKNKDFDYNLLSEDLTNRLITFCTSSKAYNEMKEQDKIGALSKLSRKSFREYVKVKRLQDDYINTRTKDGEIGELILYAFLESHLNAPKILTKMRLKTSTNDAVKRSDGIHLLKVDDGYFELIYGESKLNESLNTGIQEAFKSIYEFKNREDNNIYDEFLFLVNNIESELLNDEYEYVKNILIPSKDNIEHDVSFGVFVGFDIKIPDSLQDKRQREFRNQLKAHIKDKIIKKVTSIRAKIDELNLDEHNFYIYFVPFVNLNKVKVEILDSILE